MKKLFFSAAAILCGMAAVSCVDKNYGGEFKEDTTVSVDIKTDESENSLADYLGLGEFSKDELVTDPISGEITIVSPETQSNSADVDLNKFNSGAEVEIPAVCDMKVSVPISKKFPKDDIFFALDRPHFVIKVKNEFGKPFKYTAVITSKTGKKFNIEAEIPAVDGFVEVYVDQTGAFLSALEVNDHMVNAKPIAEFPQMFAGSPLELPIAEAKIKCLDVPKSGEVVFSEASAPIEFSAKSFFPFTVKNGIPFTMRRSFDLTGVNFAKILKDNGLKAITGVEAAVLVKHNLPLQLRLSLVEPQDVKVECPDILAAKGEDYESQVIYVKASSEAGVTSLTEAVVDITATLKGSRATYAVNEDATIILDIDKDDNGKQLVKVTGK